MLNIKNEPVPLPLISVVKKKVYFVPSIHSMPTEESVAVRLSCIVAHAAAGEVRIIPVLDLCLVCVVATLYL